MWDTSGVEVTLGGAEFGGDGAGLSAMERRGNALILFID